MNGMKSYTHWRLETDTNGILWIYFDKQNASVNTFNLETLNELKSIADMLQNNTQYKGIIFASAKKSGFIAGADITQFSEFKSVNHAYDLLRKGQEIFSRIEALEIPVVAMIDGFCLGGGLEFALSCHYRIAEDGAKTKLGLPEVKLGIHPAWGGTVRLPRLIGALQGLNLILSGHTVSARAAAKLGFVDAAVPKRHLMNAAVYYVLNKPLKHHANPLQAATNTFPARWILAKILRKKLSSKINPSHYPAPFQVIDNWERVGVKQEKAFDQEAKTCSRLFFSETSKNLVRVFHLQEKLKGLAKDKSFSPKQIHVVGAGTMGGDIAAWCALQNMTVTLQDRDASLIAPAIKRAYTLFVEKLKEPYLVQKAMDRLIPDPFGYGVAKADIIIEAIFEDLKAKQDLFKSLEIHAKPQAILATNTSSMPLDEISAVLQRPERLVGLHFFNPVAKMQLVEVVKSQRTDPLVIEKALHFTRTIERLPLPVKSSPGFLVNRILMPYLLESMVLMEEGVPAATIDKAMIDFGMPMGPVTLADTVGLDICLSVAKYLSPSLNLPVPHRLVELVGQKKLGRKTGEGFYQYKNGKQVKPAKAPSPLTREVITDRLVLRMLDESFACLREGVVADGDLLDAGMIFGTGFAPFRGGPIHYAESKGIAELFNQFKAIQQMRGEKVDALQTWM